MNTEINFYCGKFNIIYKSSYIPKDQQQCPYFCSFFKTNNGNKFENTRVKIFKNKRGLSFTLVETMYKFLNSIAQMKLAYHKLNIQYTYIF